MATSMAAGAAVGAPAPAATTEALTIDGPTGSGVATVAQTASNDTAVGTAAPELGTTATWIWEAENESTFNYRTGATVSPRAIRSSSVVPRNRGPRAGT
jgi:hypothetical protein